MDTPIITALITASGGIIAAIVNTLLKKKDKSEAGKTVPAMTNHSVLPTASSKQSSEEEAGQSPSAASLPSPSIAMAVPRKEFPLTHSQIDKSISDAPLFHRDGIAEGYYGMRVCWLGKLTHITKINHRLRQIAFMLVGDDTSLFCVIPHDQILALISLREGALVEICGRIKNASLQSTLLDECDFSVVSDGKGA